jgi:hypothetical protein
MALHKLNLAILLLPRVVVPGCSIPYRDYARVGTSRLSPPDRCSPTTDASTLLTVTPLEAHPNDPGPRYSRCDRHVARLRCDTIQPSANGRVAGQIEAALAGYMRVGVERDVGDRVTVGN